MNFVFLKLIEFIVSAMPYSLALKIGSDIGLLGYYAGKRHRKLAVSNIVRALKITPCEAQRIARASFKNLGKNLVDFLIDKKESIEVVGYENISKDRGNIFILGHFGNWEVMGRVAIDKGVKISAVGRDIKNKGADRYIKSRRALAGISILDKKGSFKYLLSALKQKTSVAILIDQYAGRRGVFVNFLGIPTSTTASPVLLALKTGDPLVPVFILRDKAGQKIIIENPINITKTGNISEDVKINTQLMVKPLEKYIKMYPEQWWWVHRRWR